MAEQVKVTPVKHEQVTEDAPEQTKAAKNDKLKADLDSLIDEIDEVLEDNAEDFVRNYVQKGGE
jgi:prokaryotic ubiquitin-like protein Pup